MWGKSFCMKGRWISIWTKIRKKMGIGKIPIKGYVVDSNDGESDHSHKLYIVMGWQA
jgi:hypothetical protein